MNFYLAICADFLNFKRSYKLWHLLRNTVHRKQSQAGLSLTSVRVHARTREGEGEKKMYMWK